MKTEIVNRLNERRKRMNADRVEFLADLLELADKCRQFDEPELVDAAIISREFSRYGDELRKECNAKIELLAKICVARVSFRIQDMDDEDLTMERIKGSLGSGLPDVDYAPDIPRKGTKEFQELLDLAGVPEKALTYMSFNWKKLVEYASEKVKAGEPVPDCLQRMKPVFKLDLRKNNNV